MPAVSIKVCLECGREYESYPPCRVGRSKFCSRGCLLRSNQKNHPPKPPKWTLERKLKQSELFLGSRSPVWKGGKRITDDGYISVWTLDNSRHRNLEHRLVAQKALGRRLLSSEVVHHINMNKSDNRPQNLLICTRSYNTWLLKQYAEAFARRVFQSPQLA